MRILYVVHGLPPEAVGGVELQTAQLAAALGREHAVGIFTVRADPTVAEYEVDEHVQEGCQVWRVNHRYTDLASFEGTYRNAHIDARFDAVLERWRPDVVHVQHLIGLSVGMLEGAKRRGLPLVLTLHDYWFGCPKGQRIREGLALCHDIDRQLCVPCLKPQNYELRAPRTSLGRWLRNLRAPSRRRGRRLLAAYDADMQRILALPDALVTPSEFHRGMYCRQGVDPARTHVIACGLPAAPGVPIRRRAGRPFRIGLLGTLIPSKGAHVLVEAYGLLGRPEATLDLHGAWVPFHGDTGYRERLEVRARALPGSIRFHGRYEPDAVPGILAGLDALVVPSVWYESFSLVVREGFLAGVPVVASGHGAMAEAIEHGVNGLLFRPGDADDLAAQLRRLMDDPALWERLATHPQRVASVADSTARHLALYAALQPGVMAQA